MSEPLSEVQFWHWIATGSLGILVMLLSWFGKKTSDKAENALSKSEFKEYIISADKARAEYFAAAEKSRNEFRETLLTLFRKIDDHTLEDKIQFRDVTKQINDQTQTLTKSINDNHSEMLRALPKRRDD